MTDSGNSVALPTFVVLALAFALAVGLWLSALNVRHRDRENSVSVLEAIAKLKRRLEKKLAAEYIDRHRVGDHICYISNLRRFRADYPRWELTRSLEDILGRNLAQGFCRWPLAHGGVMARDCWLRGLSKVSGDLHADPPETG